MAAQEPGGARAAPATETPAGFVALPVPGSPAYAYRRLAEMSGDVPVSASTALFSPSEFLLRALPDTGAVRFGAIAPTATTVWNSDLPWTLNDGALWAGAGGSAAVTAGMYLRFGPVSLILAPTLLHAANADFQTIAYDQTIAPRRDPFASPFHRPPDSADLPLRFGRGALTRVEPGQSSLTVDLGPVAAGAATENLWWGPGVRNAIVMSDNAPGIPHLFLRTSSPVSTPAGEVSARWMVGRLSESEYFNFDADDDVRSISAVAVALRPTFEPDLTLGLTRAVYAIADSDIPVGAAFDVFRNVGRPNSLSDPEELARHEHDQVFSLFARWVFPADGFEAYAEWARFEQPASLRDLLTAPNHSQGYTLGLQWARPVGEGTLRLQAEHTYLEPSTTFDERPMVASYTSRVVPQGYTQRGQVIGAFIGPGSSGQWFAMDQIRPDWRLGAFASRIRWHTALLESQVVNPNLLMHDVSLIGGLRGGIRVGPLDVLGEYTYGKRLNYLFQNEGVSFEEDRGVDVPNHSFRLFVTAAGAGLPGR